MPTSWLRKTLLRPRAGQPGTEVRQGAARAQESEATKLWYLQHINIFADMTEAEMRRLAERTQMRRYARGKVIAYP
ncbi:MAG: hypothetical protein HY355_04295, partial [Armatimonadetes bacterium]|nr:hypothetical protein [Armatimonadota bacterium]